MLHVLLFAIPGTLVCVLLGIFLLHDVALARQALLPVPAFAFWFPPVIVVLWREGRQSLRVERVKGDSIWIRVMQLDLLQRLPNWPLSLS